MAVKVAINGFGRIGRLVLRAIVESGRTDVEVVGINDLGSVEANAHLLRYDSVHGTLKNEITTGPDWIDVGRGKIRVTAERDPAKLPWGELGVDVAMECTGLFTKREAAAKHLDALTSDHHVVSNASCTTNCLAPVAYVLHHAVGIERGFMTTIHSYTGDQATVETLHKDLHRARAAAVSMIPTSTGAAKAVGLVLPALKGKLDGTAIRVPTPNVSLVDLTFTTSRDTTAEEINEAVKAAAASDRFKGILGVNSAPLVSIDFNHNAHSSTFDLGQTVVLEKRFARILSWYDNEWGFSNRMSDVAAKIGALI